MVRIYGQRLRQAGFACVFNPARVDRAQVAALLAEDARALFADSTAVAETAHGLSYRVTVGQEVFFAKEMKVVQWYNRMRDRLYATCYRSFWAADRLLRADFLTPTPILAAKLRRPQGSRQLLVTDFCEKATELDAYMNGASREVRRQVILDLADLLSRYHHAGFYSRHLRAANILVQSEGDQRRYWFIDLHRLGSTRLALGGVFINTVTRACADFYEALTPEERHFLFVACFDLALKRNIFSRPSQQQRFVERALRQIRYRTTGA